MMNERRAVAEREIRKALRALAQDLRVDEQLDGETPHSWKTIPQHLHHLVPRETVPGSPPSLVMSLRTHRLYQQTLDLLLAERRRRYLSDVKSDRELEISTSVVGPASAPASTRARRRSSARCCSANQCSMNVGKSTRSRPVCTGRGWRTSTSAPSSTRLTTHASRRSGGTASAFITATRSPCPKLVADVVTGKLDRREVASSLPNEEGADDWLESAPLADSLDDDDHVSEEPAECSAIESEVTA